ncbi:MAG TPA: GNAT family N-acetyltransferase [Gemmatimonadales bacterium]|jgi:GNAT superfamily N-acetyltransferase
MRSEDLAFVLSLLPRLAEFPLPPWRTGEEIVAAEERTVLSALEQLPAGDELLVAESPDGERLGFMHLESETDYFRGRPYTHIGIIAVDRSGEGAGVGRALIEAAEEHARRRGDPMVTLNVFDHNSHARAVYERLGYAPEIIRYVKPLSPATAGGAPEQSD